MIYTRSRVWERRRFHTYLVKKAQNNKNLYSATIKVKMTGIQFYLFWDVLFKINSYSLGLDWTPPPTFSSSTCFSEQWYRKNSKQGKLTSYGLGGGEPPDVMSLRHADTSLPYVLGRPSTSHAVKVSAMQ